MKNKIFIGIYSLMLMLTFTACTENDRDVILFDAVGGPTSYSFEAINASETVLGSLEAEYVIVTSTTTSPTDRTFQLVLNTDETTAEPESYSMPSSVTIPANSHVGAITVTFTVNGLPVMPRTLVFDYIVPEGTALLNNNEPKAVIAFEGVTVCDTGDVDLEIVLDTYPEETSWTIEDEDGEVVASGGTYDNMPSETIMETIPLDEGCYTFTIRDAYGDGICCNYGAGSYSLACASGSTIISGGVFGAEESIFFCVN